MFSDGYVIIFLLATITTTANNMLLRTTTCFCKQQHALEKHAKRLLFSSHHTSRMSNRISFRGSNFEWNPPCRHLYLSSILFGVAGNNTFFNNTVTPIWDTKSVSAPVSGEFVSRCQLAVRRLIIYVFAQIRAVDCRVYTHRDIFSKSY